MTTPVRLRIELNKGRIGIPLRKLANVALETERFLDLVCADSQITGATGKWLARNFREGSLSCDIELHDNVTVEKAVLCRNAISQITSGNINLTSKDTYISKETFAQFGKIANHIDIDEVVGFAVYENGEPEPKKWHHVSKQQLDDINSELTRTLTYHGSIQGRIHTLFKESDYITVRHVANDELIKCYYKSNQYREVHAALNKKDAIIHIAGLITATRIERHIEQMMIEKIKSAPVYTPGDLDRFFGCAPGITGKLSTSAYIGRMRSHGK